MTTADPDVIALCAAIRANPDDDTVRLGLADALDEIGGVSVPCPTCKGKKVEEYREQGEYGHERLERDCPTCHGTGFVPDRSLSSRAELVRVQVELAKMLPMGPRQFDPRYMLPEPWESLRRRERAILAEFADGWRKGPVCTAVGPHHRDVCSGGRHEAANAQFTVECEACHGTGDAGGLTWRIPVAEWRHPVTYHRGMCRVTVPTLENAVETCPDCAARRNSECLHCRGAGHVVTPWLAAVAKAHPDVVEVWCEDRVPWEPGQLRPRSNNFTWLRRPNAGEQHAYSEMANSALPEPLHRLVVKLNRGRNGWDGSDAARLALARAVGRWMHGEGGS